MSSDLALVTWFLVELYTYMRVVGKCVNWNFVTKYIDIAETCMTSSRIADREVGAL